MLYMLQNEYFKEKINSLKYSFMLYMLQNEYFKEKINSLKYSLKSIKNVKSTNLKLNKYLPIGLNISLCIKYLIDKKLQPYVCYKKNRNF